MCGFISCYNLCFAQARADDVRECEFLGAFIYDVTIYPRNNAGYVHADSSVNLV